VENTRLVASLERSLAELHELNRLKDDFVSSVSHELRTPLTVMQGFVKTLLRTDASFPDAERRSFLEAVDRNSDRLRHLIERLLLMARLESDRQTLQVSEVSLNALCQGVADEVAESAPHHRYQLVAEEDVVVDTDETMLHQILVNLVENAAKYSPLGATVLIRVHRGTAEALVSVEDQGAGVPPADRERIFERFYRVDRSDTRTIGGAGLGLYIARRLANEIAGSVSLSRSDERGSVFVMSLPLRRPAPPPSANGHGDHAENAIASLATSGASGVPVPAAPEG
jgi:signal transduction histidine kinase